MTREEAIDILAESKRQNEVMRDNLKHVFWCHTKWLMELKMQKDELQLLTSPFPPSAPSAVSRWSGCGENG